MPKYYTCQEAIDLKLWEQETPISEYDALAIAIPLDSLADNYDEDAPSVRYPETYC